MDDRVSTKLDMDITILVGECVYIYIYVCMYVCMYIHVGLNM